MYGGMQQEVADLLDTRFSCRQRSLAEEVWAAGDLLLLLLLLKCGSCCGTLGLMLAVLMKVFFVG